MREWVEYLWFVANAFIRTDPMLEAIPEPTIGLHPRTLLVASQALSLGERRRFDEHKPTSGRALPARFAVGIAYDLWTAGEAGGV